MLLALRCPVCDRHGAAPCSACAAQLRPAPELEVPAGLDDLWAVLAYEGVGRELVSRLKYRNARAAVPALTRAMAARVGSAQVDVVTWAPTTPARRRERGFDQAELLARAVARCLERRCPPLLRRLEGPPQTGQNRVDRRTGPKFIACGPVPGHVLIVDDVVTTGATLSAAARALRAAGAGRVLAVAAARTPSPGH